MLRSSRPVWVLGVAVRQEVEREDLLALGERLQAPGGVTDVQALLRRAVQKEYRIGA